MQRSCGSRRPLRRKSMATSIGGDVFALVYETSSGVVSA